MLFISAIYLPQSLGPFIHLSLLTILQATTKMCWCSFTSSSVRRGGADMAFKHPPSSSPHYVPLPPLSATAIVTQKMNRDDGSTKKERGRPSQSPRSVLERSQGLRSNKNRVGLGIGVSTPSQRLPQSKKKSSQHKAAPPIAPQLCHKPTLLPLQQHEEDHSFLWSSSSSEEEEETEREGHVSSIFSVGSPFLVSPLGDDHEEEEHPPPLMAPLMEEILKACFLCKRSFADGKDIYIYRGERAFCSEDCRYHQILMDYKGGHLDGSSLLF